MSQSNVIVIANIPPKFTTIGEGTNGVVTTGPNGKQFVLTYPTNSTLQSATNVAGPWAPVAGATSPYTNILQKAIPDVFFRLSYP